MKETPEPEGQFKENRSSNTLHFVVQRHQASKLHNDFRLELGRVLKSWAVLNGPSLNPADKRLTIEVEDHPLEYRHFESDMPEDQYCGGHLNIWGEGTCRAENSTSPRRSEKELLVGLNEGSISIVLEGQKTAGGFFAGKNAGR